MGKILKDDIKTLVVVALVCSICVILVLVLNIKNNSDKLTTVTEYNSFFSTAKYINNYLNELSKEDYETIYNLVYQDYIKENNITEDNIFNYIETYSDDISLKIVNMEYVKVKNNYIYYVEGKLIENGYESRNIIDDDFRIIVLLDFDNLTTAIYPLQEDDNYKKIIDNIKVINITENNDNSFDETALITKEDVCIMYLSDYIDKLNNDFDSAYKILSDNMKKLYPNSNSYRQYIESKIDKITTVVDSCKMEKIEDNRVYTIIDNNKNMYTFDEESIFNYKVDIYFADDLKKQTNDDSNISVDNKEDINSDYKEDFNASNE